MPRELDLTTWSRRPHFDFFRRFEIPFFNLCAEVDVTALADRCAAPQGPSFFLSYLHASLRAANDIEAFHYRIRGEGVIEYEVVHGGTTVIRPDETFSFAYFDYHPDYDRFAPPALRELERRRAVEEKLEPRDDRDDLIHYSVLPWVSFTSFAHARRLGREDSVPKIVFGKHHEVEGRRRMPVSVEVHHALMDGLHVGRYFARFQELLDAAAP